MTGLKSAIDSIQPGMTESGTIAPPSIAITIGVAQPAPATACSLRPIMLSAMVSREAGCDEIATIAAAYFEDGRDCARRAAARRDC